jgi:hypothetical protein
MPAAGSAITRFLAAWRTSEGRAEVGTRLRGNRPVGAEPTDETLGKLAQLLYAIDSTLKYEPAIANDQFWQRLCTAYDIAAGIDTKEARVAQYVSNIERAITNIDDPNTMPMLLFALTWLDPAFAHADQGKLRASVRLELRGAKPRADVQKGGGGSAGPVSVAATLAYQFGAFGYRQKPKESPAGAAKRVATNIRFLLKKSQER